MAIDHNPPWTIHQLSAPTDQLHTMAADVEILHSGEIITKDQFDLSETDWVRHTQSPLRAIPPLLKKIGGNVLLNYLRGNCSKDR